MRTISKTTIAVLAGLTLAGSLASCATQTEADPTEETTSEATTPVEETPGEATDTTYTDGTYTDTGSYQAPSGNETIEVTITLKNDIIESVDVVGEATDPQAKLHQGEFINGIAGIVVGKDIDTIKVDKVGGSSLTSNGFNAAIDAIKAEAAA